MEKLSQELQADMPYHWKIQSITKSGDKAQCVAYIDARDLMDRLDEVVGLGNWRDSYRREENGRLVCKLEIKIGDEWVWREDTGTEGNFEQEKSEFSDAFKRAGVKWGVGRFLYDLDIQWVNVQNKQPVDESGKRIYDLTKYINDRMAGKKEYKSKAKSSSPSKTVLLTDGQRKAVWAIGNKHGWIKDGDLVIEGSKPIEIEQLTKEAASRFIKKYGDK